LGKEFLGYKIRNLLKTVSESFDRLRAYPEFIEGPTVEISQIDNKSAKVTTEYHFPLRKLGDGRLRIGSTVNFG